MLPRIQGNHLIRTPSLKIEAMNGYANLLRDREVPAGYRGAALIRGVLGSRHRVAVQQNISCPLL